MSLAMRRHTDVIAESLALTGKLGAGKLVLDVGCGSGGLTRFLARAGARAIGVEPGAAALAAARAAPREGDERYVEGAGERLPFPDRSVDAVIYLNSLHHVALAAQAAAILDAGRVLVAGGALLVIEPLAEGSNFELTRNVDDETEVRAAAYAALRESPSALFAHEHEETYDTAVRHADFAAFCMHMLAVDPARAPALERVRERLARDFARLGRPDRDAPDRNAMCFSQPCRLNLLRRRA